MTMAIQNNALTINQEKYLRRMRSEHPTLRAHEMSRLSIHEKLAHAVAQYRRAQRLTANKEAADLRKEFLDVIDDCLLRLGFK
jgi:hypothetical protein